MTEEEQLTADLIKHATNKLKRWEADVLDVFEMAELDHRKATLAIISAMIAEIAKMSALFYGLDEEVMMHQFKHAFREARVRLNKDPEYKEWLKECEEKHVQGVTK